MRGLLLRRLWLCGPLTCVRWRWMLRPCVIGGTDRAAPAGLSDPTRRDLLGVGLAQAPHHARPAESGQDPTAEVGFPEPDGVLVRPGERMVVVLEPLAEGENRHRPVVGAAVAVLERPAADHVAH